MLNLTHTRTFLAVIDEKGIRAAAKALDISPSTVVQHLNQLEMDLLAPLVVRGRGATHPTAQGERFIPYARSLVATALRAKDLIASPVVRLAAASNVGIYLLQQPLAAFGRASGFEIDLWIGPNPAVVNRLDTFAADIVATEWWDGRTGYRAIRWIRAPLVVIVSPDHRWAKRKSITVGELVNEPLLGGEPGTGTGTLLRERLGALADRLRTKAGLGSTEAVKRAVRAGHGASIVLEAAVRDEIAGGQLVALEIPGSDLFKEIWLVMPDHIPAGSPSMKLIDGLRGYADSCTSVHRQPGP